MKQIPWAATAIALALALICAVLVDAIGLPWWIFIAVAVLLVAAVLQLSRPPSLRHINGRTVFVQMGPVERQRGTVIKWTRMADGLTATVQMDGEAPNRTILMKARDLEFPWYEMLRHRLPFRVPFCAAPVEWGHESY